MLGVPQAPHWLSLRSGQFRFQRAGPGPGRPLHLEIQRALAPRLQAALLFQFRLYMANS